MNMNQWLNNKLDVWIISINIEYELNVWIK